MSGAPKLSWKSPAFECLLSDLFAALRTLSLTKSSWNRDASASKNSGFDWVPLLMNAATKRCCARVMDSGADGTESSMLS